MTERWFARLSRHALPTHAVLALSSLATLLFTAMLLSVAPQPARADDPDAPVEVDVDPSPEEEHGPDTGPDRPTSGVISMWSGRTLGNGHSAIAAGVGWPGLFVELALAPSSRLNIGGRLQVNYGSPLMGIGDGIGGDLQVPIRFHFYGREDLDLALAIRPGFTFGQGALVGQQGGFANDFAWAGRLDAGVLLGAHTSESITLTFGLLGGAGLSDVTGVGLEVFGTFYATAAIEAVVSRDTMLFALLEGGYGLARAERFDTTAIFRLWLGLAYEL